MRMRRVFHQQSGVSLIEILVAFTLLAAVMLLITRAFLTIITVTSRGGNLTVATALAARRLEQIRTSVEAQQDWDEWRKSFCNVNQVLVKTPFPVPHQAYEYRVLTNQNAIKADPNQDINLLLPCFAIEWARPGCTGPQYDPSDADKCDDDPQDLGDENRLRWVTVEVYFRGGAQPVVRQTSAIVRGAYHK